MAKSILIQVLTFRIPLGTTGRMSEPQSRMLIETGDQYRAAIDPRMQAKSVEDRLRNGEVLLMRRNGGWYPMCRQVDVVGQEMITIVY